MDDSEERSEPDMIKTVKLKNGRSSRSKPITLEIQYYPLSEETVESLAQLIAADILSYGLRVKED